MLSHGLDSKSQISAVKISGIRPYTFSGDFGTPLPHFLRACSTPSNGGRRLVLEISKYGHQRNSSRSCASLAAARHGTPPTRFRGVTSPATPFCSTRGESTRTWIAIHSHRHGLQCKNQTKTLGYSSRHSFQAGTPTRWQGYTRFEWESPRCRCESPTMPWGHPSHASFFTCSASCSLVIAFCGQVACPRSPKVPSGGPNRTTCSSRLGQM